MACKRKSKGSSSSASKSDPASSKKLKRSEKPTAEEKIPQASSSPASKLRRTERVKRKEGTEAEEEIPQSPAKQNTNNPSGPASSVKLRRTERLKRTEKRTAEEEVSQSMEIAAPLSSSSKKPKRAEMLNRTEKSSAKEEAPETVDKAVSSPENPNTNDLSEKTSSKKLKRTQKRKPIPTAEEEIVRNVEKVASSSVVPNTNDVSVEDADDEARFIGKPVNAEEAQKKWPKRYRSKSKIVPSSSDEDVDLIQARCHYTKGRVDGFIYNLYDDAYVFAGEGEPLYICKIMEMFEAVDGLLYFIPQWYYRGSDTVIKNSVPITSKRVFFSDVRDINPLDCLVKKLHIARLTLEAEENEDSKKIPSCDYYCDTKYLLPYSTFVNLPTERMLVESDNSTISSEVDLNGGCEVNSERVNLGIACESNCELAQDTLSECDKSEFTLLDVYAGCGAMSTGLCLGARLCNINLVTKWAVDFNKEACDSLKLNHPETEVRNEAAEDFLALLNQWRGLCICFNLVDTTDSPCKEFNNVFKIEDDEEEEEEEENDADLQDSNTFEVDYIVGLCFGDPNEKKEKKLHFKIRWKGYGPEEDTWEPYDGLGHCTKAIKDFVCKGYAKKILPFPGDVDVVCGGPPCQGVSGFNRFRNAENPLEDDKNKQLIVFMDIVEYLQPKFVLMENVVDLVKFSDGFLGRYALGRLVKLNYQARMGMMAAGAYGLPQFRMRVFLWGARPNQRLPQYPLPTHDVVVRGNMPTQFEANAVAYDEGQKPQLEKKLLLTDAISDLPPVENSEKRDKMPYEGPPKTEFERLIRLSKDYLMGLSTDDSLHKSLYDHVPLELNVDDYTRVCQIPKKKGANFRDLPGVRVTPDGKAELDPDVERVFLESGKPLVPDYAITFVRGTSTKPFKRLWWDETVPTVVTRAEPHNQAIMHPEQDRVLTIRENARLQGFPDYYKLCGPVKARYTQVGNAVAVPVARALGYSLGLALKGTAGPDPLFQLPDKFPNIVNQSHSLSSDDDS